MACNHGRRVRAADARGPVDADLRGTAALPIDPLAQLVVPQRFVAHQLGWRAWLQPVAKAELTAAQRESLIKPERADNPYFRLLARDPAALKARTLTDLDIFYNTDGGLGRAAREFAATVTSRLNGCVYCASVHAGRTLSEEPGRSTEIDQLLARGAQQPVGEPIFDAVRGLAVALTATPPEVDSSHIEALLRAGLDEVAVVDAINSVAFFNWANRLMLGLGRPELPRRYR
ncbi:alkylhydroperoxidase domain protein [Corynebacterium atypicum]|uniref:alkylhydroperoxidase domain protein n=1 Tax=Corynebacterium atypicum TaxID=191610 RepID=UPI002E20B5FC|nr:alkylhydroperoxidase domain protein [Corynebacterium atypicum]